MPDFRQVFMEKMSGKIRNNWIDGDNEMQTPLLYKQLAELYASR